MEPNRICEWTAVFFLFFIFLFGHRAWQTINAPSELCPEIVHNFNIGHVVGRMCESQIVQVYCFGWCMPWAVLSISTERWVCAWECDVQSHSIEYMRIPPKFFFFIFYFGEEFHECARWCDTQLLSHKFLSHLLVLLLFLAGPSVFRVSLCDHAMPFAVMCASMKF